MLSTHPWLVVLGLAIFMCINASCRQKTSSSKTDRQIGELRDATALYTPCPVHDAETILKITVNHPSIGAQSDTLPLRSTNVLPEFPDWNPSIGNGHGTTASGDPFASGLSVGYISSQPGAVTVSVYCYIILFDRDVEAKDEKPKQELVLDHTNFVVSVNSSSVPLLDQGEQGFHVTAEFCDPITKP